MAMADHEPPEELTAPYLDAKGEEARRLRHDPYTPAADTSGKGPRYAPTASPRPRNRAERRRGDRPEKKRPPRGRRLTVI